MLFVLSEVADASRFDDVKCLAMLVQAGANVNARCFVDVDLMFRTRTVCPKLGFTALHHAVADRLDSVVAYLLNDCAVDCSIQDARGRTALDLAEFLGYEKSASRIREHSSSLRAQAQVEVDAAQPGEITGALLAEYGH